MSVARFGNPIVVIGCASVVNGTARHFSADAGYKHRAVFFRSLRFPLVRSKIGIFAFQIIGIQKRNIFRERRRDRSVVIVNIKLGALQTTVNFFYDFVQVKHRAIFRLDRHFPIPLIDVQRMNRIERFVGTDRIHIRVNAETRSHAELRHFQALPLGERLHDFHALVFHIFYRKRYRPFDAVQIVVYAESALYEKRRRNARQIQFGRKRRLEKIFYQDDRVFRLFRIQYRLIMQRQFIHKTSVINN